MPKACSSKPKYMFSAKKIREAEQKGYVQAFELIRKIIKARMENAPDNYQRGLKSALRIIEAKQLLAKEEKEKR